MFLNQLSAAVESIQQLIHAIKWHLVNAENILEISFDNNKHPESSKRGIVNCLTGATFAATIRHLYLWDEESKTLIQQTAASNYRKTRVIKFLY